MHLEKRWNIPNYVVYHFWNIMIIVDCIGKYFVYNTNLFGHFTLRRGLLSIYSTMYPGIAILLLYTTTLIIKNDVVFWMLWVYKMQVFTLWAAILLYAFDGALFVSNKRMFCKLQLEKADAKTCDSRNEYFLVTVAIFYIFWVPVWRACNISIERYVRTMIRQGKESLRIPKLDPSRIDIRHFHP